MSKEEVSGPRLLAELAEQTGGRLSARPIPPISQCRRQDRHRTPQPIRSSDSPKNAAKDGKYRKVEVKVTGQPGMPDLKVHWRLGYYAPPDKRPCLAMRNRVHYDGRRCYVSWGRGDRRKSCQVKSPQRSRSRANPGRVAAWPSINRRKTCGARPPRKQHSIQIRRKIKRTERRLIRTPEAESIRADHAHCRNAAQRKIVMPPIARPEASILLGSSVICAEMALSAETA